MRPRWSFWITAVLFLVGFAAAAQDYQQPDIFLRYSYKLENNRIVERGVFKEHVPRFAELERDRFRYNNYEQFIDYLLTEAPSLKNHFVVLHHSQSLQLTSFEHPRLLLFDGGMVFAFAEHPENRDKRVEILEVDPATYEIQMREIVFAENNQIQFNAKPKACASCHGQPAKPLWDPYDFWPNSFGSSVGAVSTRQEAEAFAKLRANASSSPILSRLQLMPAVGLGAEENTAYTQFIHQINVGRWMRQELAGKALEEIRYPLLATVNGCFSTFPRAPFSEQKAQVLEYFPVGSMDARVPLLDRIFADVVDSRRHTKSFQERLLLEYFPKPDFIQRTDHERLQAESGDVALLRWLLDLAGVNAANLSTSHMANDYLLSSPSFFLLDTMMVLYELKPELFAGLSLETQDLFSGRPAWLKLDCQELKQKSLLEEKNFTAPGSWRSYQRLQRERPVISRCAKCHSEGLSPRAPHIPFEDSLALARRVRDARDDLGGKILQRIESQGRDQMPPAAPLSRDEIEAMREFVEALR